MFELRNNYIKFPERDEDMLKTINLFAGKSNLPFVMGPSTAHTWKQINQKGIVQLITFLESKSIPSRIKQFVMVI